MRGKKPNVPLRQLLSTLIVIFGSLLVIAAGIIYIQVAKAEPSAIQSAGVAQQDQKYNVTVRKSYEIDGQVIVQESYSYEADSSSDANHSRQTLAQTIADDDKEILFVYTDHLGSANTVVDAKTNHPETSRFLPFGEVWGGNDAAIDATGRGFTGHRENRDLGLTYMNARFYLPSVGRFASADTIVPDPASPQAFNRYAYVQNNPIRFVDPTGRCGADTGEDAETKTEECKRIESDLESAYSIQIDYEELRWWQILATRTTWTLAEIQILAAAFSDAEIAHGGRDRVAEIFNGVTFSRSRKDNGDTLGAYHPSNNRITFFDGSFSSGANAGKWAVLHEMGHRFDAFISWEGSGNANANTSFPYEGESCPIPIIYCKPALKDGISNYEDEYLPLSADMWEEYFGQAYALTVYSGPTPDLPDGYALKGNSAAEVEAIEYVTGFLGR